MIGELLAKVAPHSVLSETMLPPAPKFKVEQIPDLAGKVIIVTGGNAGIGLETARVLLTKGAKVYIACRSQQKAEEALATLKKETGKDAIFLELDLGDLRKVKKSAEEYLSRERTLDILFNNAGVMVPPLDQVTAQDYDLQFGTNTLGHYYFTKLLVPALKASYEKNGVKPRVVHTSSTGHQFIPKETINFDTLVKGEKRDAAFKKWGMQRQWIAYGQSKTGNILVSHMNNDDYGDFLVSCSIHPGGVRTRLSRHMGWQALVLNPFMYPVTLGALTQLYAGTAAPEDEIKGKYLVPWARIGKPHPETDDPAIRQQVKEWMEQQIAAVSRD